MASTVTFQPKPYNLRKPAVSFKPDGARSSRDSGRDSLEVFGGAPAISSHFFQNPPADEAFDSSDNVRLVNGTETESEGLAPSLVEEGEMQSSGHENGGRTEYGGNVDSWLSTLDSRVPPPNMPYVREPSFEFFLDGSPHSGKPRPSPESVEGRGVGIDDGELNGVHPDKVSQWNGGSNFSPSNPFSAPSSVFFSNSSAQPPPSPLPEALEGTAVGMDDGERNDGDPDKVPFSGSQWVEELKSSYNGADNAVDSNEEPISGLENTSEAPDEGNDDSETAPRLSGDLGESLASFQQTFVVSDATRPDFPILYASAGFYQMTGYTVEEVIGKNCRFLQGVDTNQEDIERIRTSLREGRSFCGRILNYRKDGTSFWNLLTISPIKDDEGKVVKYVGMQVEVSKYTEGNMADELRPNGMPASLIKYDSRQQDRATSSVKELVGAIKHPQHEQSPHRESGGGDGGTLPPLKDELMLKIPSRYSQSNMTAIPAAEQYSSKARSKSEHATRDSARAGVEKSNRRLSGFMQSMRKSSSIQSYAPANPSGKPGGKPFTSKVRSKSEYVTRNSEKGGSGRSSRRRNSELAGAGKRNRRTSSGLIHLIRKTTNSHVEAELEMEDLDLDDSVPTLERESLDHDSERAVQIRRGMDLATTLERIEKNFVITDPRLPDNPIIFASDHFLELTEYSREEVIGRNCRFLQGQDTDMGVVGKIGDAIRNQQNITVQLLNYTKTGKPFWNLFHLEAMKDNKGELQYFIGVQLDGSDHIEPIERRMSAKTEVEGKEIVQSTAKNIDGALRDLPDANTSLEDLWTNHSRVVFPKPHKRVSPTWHAVRKTLSTGETLGLNHFRPIKPLGCGDTGSVHLVELRNTTEFFAMKAMEKTVMVNRNKVHRARVERDILDKMDHPFLPTLYGSFQTQTHVCLITDFCPGGELFYLQGRQPQKRFHEDSARFYAAEIVVALEYLHCQGVVYRDLKPENVLLQKDGHVQLTDFDLSLLTASRPQLHTPEVQPGKRRSSKNLRKEEMERVVLTEPNAKSNSFVGTEEYIAPEIILGLGHGSSVDWWALGILLYEMLFGRTPFRGRNRQRTFANVLVKDLVFPSSIPVSFETKQVLRGLLCRDPKQRLGSQKGANDLKNHMFFDCIDWPLIRTMDPPALDSPVLQMDEEAECKDLDWEDGDQGKVFDEAF